MLSASFSAAATTSSSEELTNTPTISRRRRSPAPISTAASGSQKRGLSGWWFSPIAHAPSRAASWASSILVMPQNFTLIAPNDGRRAVPRKRTTRRRAPPRNRRYLLMAPRSGARGCSALLRLEPVEDAEDRGGLGPDVPADVGDDARDIGDAAPDVAPHHLVAAGDVAGERADIRGRLAVQPHLLARGPHLLAHLLHPLVPPSHVLFPPSHVLACQLDMRVDPRQVAFEALEELGLRHVNLLLHPGG